MAGPEFRTYDVFTDRRFGGNPLAVVFPSGPLGTPCMQAVAREFNYSETVFVLPAEQGGTARLRIFTPQREIPFAGHPTIGTAICLAERALEAGAPLPGDLVLEEGAGPIPCRVEERDGRLFATLVNELPLELGREVDAALLARCLGLEEAEVATGNHLPLFASKGLRFVLAEIDGTAALEAISLDLSAFSAAALRYPECEGDFAVVAYCNRGQGRVEMRMFSPLDSIPEDPATGSAAAALAAHVCLRTGAPQDLEILQGLSMGRPSRILATAESPGPGQSLVTVGGTAVRVMQGHLAEI
ncbi:PhzF family phenazine biosynthesis protein [Poseidonocella sp. HB161398]|uniref:PhzF family phenazine biosynthesis protein n=1 Tax=Poseidonocella sp. HB161398 TaxID=2320855 RepID=UPI00110948A2|nr:PhzF family phenazine biosynthesis protein [Poseidonocella sp. HB161398]